MYDIATKKMVRSLRSQGKTYSEIMSALRIDFPKSTLSDWCKDVVLPKWYQDKVDELNRTNFSKARKFSRASQMLKQENFLKRVYYKENSTITPYLKNKIVLKLILSTLYLGEGAKWKSHRGMMLGSSDPNIIKLYIKLLTACYDIPIDKMKCRVSYRADQDIISLQEYWSRVTSIPVENFYKTKPDARTVGKPTKQKGYKGVCVVMCAGTAIQLEFEVITKIILEKLYK